MQIGATQRSKPGPDAQNHVIKRLVDHKRFNHDKHLNNIALVELDKPVVCNDYVQPACLPEGDLVIDSLTHCYICGWGIVTMECESLQKLNKSINKPHPPLIPIPMNIGALGTLWVQFPNTLSKFGGMSERHPTIGQELLKASHHSFGKY